MKCVLYIFFILYIVISTLKIVFRTIYTHRQTNRQRERIYKTAFHALMTQKNIVHCSKRGNYIWLYMIVDNPFRHFSWCAAVFLIIYSVAVRLCCVSIAYLSVHVKETKRESAWGDSHVLMLWVSPQASVSQVNIFQLLKRQLDYQVKLYLVVLWVYLPLYNSALILDILLSFPEAVEQLSGN